MVDDIKIQALIIHVASRCKGLNKPLSQTLLNKFFYNVDFGHYAIHNEHITGFAYKKDLYGPVPTEIGYYLGLLSEGGDIFFENLQHAQSGTTYISINTEYDEGVDLEEYFSEDEIDTINKTFEAISVKTASEVSRDSHRHYTWITAPKQDYIPIQNAKYCSFEWLDYYGEGKDRDDFEETEAIRRDISKNYELSKLMKTATSSRKPLRIRKY